MKYFTSKYFIRPIVLNWTIGVLFFYEIFWSNENFLSNEILKEYIQQIEVVLILIYFIATLWAFFYLLFYSIQKQDIENKILKLEKDKEEDSSSIYKKQELLTKLSKYRLIHKNLADNSNYVHLLNSKDEITNDSNSQYYLFIFLLLFFGQNSFDYLSPIGPIIFMAFVFIFIVSSFRILFWELLRKKSYTTPAVISHILIIAFLFVWGKNSYVRSFGNEIIGDYLEKRDYTTNYHVILFSKDETWNDSLPVEIHVSSNDGWVYDIDSNYYKTKKYGKKHWMVENLKVSRFNNGNSIPNVLENSDWVNLQSPGYCQFNNINDKEKNIGFLYNGYSVNDKICPIGWHVPNEKDWLDVYQLFDSINKHNSSNLKLSQGHRRGMDGLFYYVPSNSLFEGNGPWWCSSKSNSLGWNRGLDYVYMSYSDVSYHDNGLSIRCVKD